MYVKDGMKYPYKVQYENFRRFMSDIKKLFKWNIKKMYVKDGMKYPYKSTIRQFP